MKRVVWFCCLVLVMVFAGCATGAQLRSSFELISINRDDIISQFFGPSQLNPPLEYSLAADSADTDNDLFIIDGRSLKAKNGTTLTSRQYHVRAQVRQNSFTMTKDFIFSVGSPPPPQAASARSAAPSSAASAAKPAAPSNLFYTGDGGKDISIAILAPKATGLANNQMYLPVLVQGEFVSNFTGYSAISVLDRVRLDDQYSELFSGYYDDKATAEQDLGHLTPTSHIMGGSITKTATGYALQISITKTTDKMTVASYSGTCTFAELDNLSGIRRASLDLLQKMDIVPTERAQTELATAAADNHVNAQTALAQGITAQRNGAVVEALSYFIQSANYEPALAEASSRMNVVSVNIRSGNIGNDVRNDIQWRKDWVARLEEAERYYTNYIRQNLPPLYYLVYKTDIKQGAVNYQNETVALSGIQIAAMPEVERFKTINSVIPTVREGLITTGRAETWGLDKWPGQSVSSPSPFTDQTKNWAVVAEIFNSEGKSIGKETINLPYGWKFNNPIIAPIVTRYRELTFPAVNANLITDSLTVRISSIDGVSAENAARQKRVSILLDDEYRRIPSVQENAMYPDGGGYYLNNGHLQIAYGVTSFNYFKDTSGATSVTIPNSVTSIRGPMFNGRRLTSLTIGANVRLSDNSFDGDFTNLYDQNGKKAGTYVRGPTGKKLGG